jgi:GNAT superfamily N-acetyltransferase
MLVRELVDKAEMLEQLSVLNELYPKLTLEEYSVELDEMLPHRYGQVAVFDENECIAISGFWIGNKLWVGKYLELDNIIVREKYRSQGVGKLMFDFLEKKAKEQQNKKPSKLDMSANEQIGEQVLLTRQMKPDEIK